MNAPAEPAPGSIRLRRDSGLYGYERALHRAGLDPVAGADEAGRGACAGPLVAGAVILGESKARRIEGLRDSKLLTPLARERLYAEITRKALAWAVVAVPPQECDRLGMHVANLAALRRALVRLELPPTYVLTDGFSVDGLGVPGLAVWKGDRVAACVAAASILAKVTRDRIMAQEHLTYPQYAFDVHKGYCTPLHQERLDAYGPSPTHRRRFVNVRRAAGPLSSASGRERATVRGATGEAAEDVVAVPTDDDADEASRLVVAAQPTGGWERWPRVAGAEEIDDLDAYGEHDEQGEVRAS